MQIAKSKNVEVVGLMEQRLVEMGKELSELRDKEYNKRAEFPEKIEGDSIGHNGNPLNGGNLMYNFIQILCTFPKIPMGVVPDQDSSR